MPAQQQRTPIASQGTNTLGSSSSPSANVASATEKLLPRQNVTLLQSRIAPSLSCPPKQSGGVARSIAAGKAKRQTALSLTGSNCRESTGRKSQLSRRGIAANRCPQRSVAGIPS